MAQLKPLEENGFALTFNKKIEEPRVLIKYGDKKGPIREGVDLKCKTKQSSYQYDNSSKSVDFQIDDDECINTELSSGNFCSQPRPKLSLWRKGVK